MTGQEMISDFSIADLFASLKSDHIPGAPVRLTRTSSVESAVSSPFRSSAARTISVGLAAAPARTMTVRPSSDGWGATTEDTRSSCSRMRVALMTTPSSSPSPRTTTVRA